jgi:hypothetical protein
VDTRLSLFSKALAEDWEELEEFSKVLAKVAEVNGTVL